MSNRTKKIKDEITEAAIFRKNVDNTVYGSLIDSIQAMVPSLRDGDFAFARKIKTCRFPTIESENFIKDTVVAYWDEDTYEDYVVGLPLAMVETEKNSLFFPYVEDDNGEKTIWPFRNDGHIPRSALDENKTIKEIEW